MQVDGHNKKSDPLLDQLSTEELERLLRTPDGAEPDVDFILKVMEVIQSREDESDTPQPDVDNAWKEFQDNYQGQADAYEISPPQEQEPRSVKQNRRIPRALRWDAILAAVLLLLCGTASAFGMNIFQAIADWTAETFRFTSAKSGAVVQAVPEDDVYAELREAVAEYTDTPVVPTWAPEGTEQVGELSIVEYANGVRIQGTFQFYKKEFTIRVQIYQETPDFDITSYQKDSISIEKYEHSGITFYILNNINQCGTVWIDGASIIFIQGNLDTENIQDMIKSIYGE